jgi:hypothetical protein
MELLIPECLGKMLVLMRLKDRHQAQGKMRNGQAQCLKGQYKSHAKEEN